jgi:hypothetical protein
VLATGGRGVVGRDLRAVAIAGLEVAGGDVADHLEQGVGVDVGEHVIHAGADQRQRIGHRAIRFRGPPGDDRPIGPQRIHATAAADRVGEDVGDPAADRPGEVEGPGGRPRGRRVGVELGRGDDDLRPRVARDVADGRRVDDLGPGEGGILELAREARQRIALPVPGVDVLVEGRDDDLEVGVADEVAERRRGDEAALDMVVTCAVGRGGLGRVEPDGEAGDHAAVGVPGVHVLAGGVDDLRLEVPVDVADGGRAEDLPRRSDLGV